jgi:hypothetical protein
MCLKSYGGIYANVPGPEETKMPYLLPNLVRDDMQACACVDMTPNKRLLASAARSLVMTGPLEEAAEFGGWRYSSIFSKRMRKIPSYARSTRWLAHP